MTALLVVVTLASLALAGALLVYVLKLSREERDRSEARAAALAELLEAQAPLAGQQEAVRPVEAVTPVEQFSSAYQERSHYRERSQPIHPEPANALEPAEAADQSRTADLFASATAGPARGHAMRRLLAPAIGVAIVGLALASVYLWNRPAAVQQTAQAAARPLELVTLRHQRQGDTLVITGLVRNPPNATAITGLVAVAFAFDKQGGFLTSGRSVLDFPQLKAGDESPFSITIPQAGGVGRYRVSFRTDAGIVPHVDHRSAAPAAVQQAAAQ
jgi:type II secretory pathway pseudopilin PulG